MPELHLFSFVVINILTNMVNILNNSIYPFKSTYSTVTNGNNFLKIHHKIPMQTSKVCFFSVQSIAIFPDLSCVKPGNIGPFSSGDESVVLKEMDPKI